jgi:small nuclear ribonucleoprotein (snRNP)-like protein
MENAFVGLTVSLLLNDGSTIRGVVAGVDPDTQLLTLTNGKLNDGKKYFYSLHL